MKAVERRKEMASGEPMNLNVHSGGMMEVMCSRRAGRWGSGRVSTRNATFVGSYGEGGVIGAGHSNFSGSAQVMTAVTCSCCTFVSELEVARGLVRTFQELDSSQSNQGVSRFRVFLHVVECKKEQQEENCPVSSSKPTVALSLPRCHWRFEHA